MTAALAAQITGHYEKHAAAWSADRAALPAGGSVLDLGCGSGVPVAALLAACGLRVTGVDAAPSMLAMGRARMPEQRWIEGDMRGLDLGERFDGVLAWDSFFHLCPADQRAMMPVFARHAAPGARLMFTAGPEAGERVGAYRGDPLYHASLDPAEYRALLAAHGFDTTDFVVEDRGAGGRTVVAARFGNGIGRERGGSA